MEYSYERIIKPDGTIDLEQLKENFRRIEEDRRNSPYLYGKGTPFNITNASLGSIYADTNNGNVYKRKYASGVNNGWVELEESERIGFIKIWGSSQIPTNYKICDGSAISRVTYSVLFNLIGTTFGSGDGASTFNLPDLRSAVPRGVGTSSKFTYNSSVSLGEVKNDTVQGTDHYHLEYTDNSAGGKIPYTSDGEGVGPYTTGKYGAPGGPTYSRWLTTSPIYTWVNNYGSPRIDNETTCKAIGMHYIIKIL